MVRRAGITFLSLLMLIGGLFFGSVAASASPLTDAKTELAILEADASKAADDYAKAELELEAEQTKLDVLQADIEAK